MTENTYVQQKTNIGWLLLLFKVKRLPNCTSLDCTTRPI